MKTFYLIPLLLLVSCSSVKFKELNADEDATQLLIGKIKQMEVEEFIYRTNKNDSTIKFTTICYFNKKNKIVKQLDRVSYLDGEMTTVYNYNNKGLLENILSANTTTYAYDAKKNVIEYRVYRNDTLSLLKTYTYDKRNNPVKITFFRPKDNARKNSTDNYNYNYKERSKIVKTSREGKENDNHFLKYYYDKKGFLIKKGSSLFLSAVEFKYDKAGNLTTKTNFDNSGNITNLTEYKNTYDAKGNIIIREKYSNGELTKKTTNKITYW